MAKEFDNRSRGVLFKNDRKSEEKHPDFTGTYMDADGKEYFVDAWVREGAKGKFFSFRTKEKQARKEAAGGDGPFDDSMPF
jgi:hypothetical protein